MRRALSIVVMAALSLAAPPTAAQVGTLFNREGYRIAHYRAPAHRAPAGVVRIAPAAAAQLRPDVDALFIDVLPAEGGQRQADGLWRLARPHESIPGARWFPEAGRGELADDVEGWFLAGIGRLSHGRRDRPIILFCLADCWMSWNAARRLKAQGYPQVWWLAEGVDGWRDLGLPLAPVTPGGGVAR